MRVGHTIGVRYLGILVALPALLSFPSLAEQSSRKPPELPRGQPYFFASGRPGFVLGRNPTEASPEAFEKRFDEMAASGESLARIHLMHGMPPAGKAGQIDEAWAARWERVFRAAERRGIAVIPVFSLWAQWNDGSGGELWHVWHDNPYNAANKGLAARPSELLGDTECRRLWLGWLAALVRRWSSHKNLVAWEPISEIDLVTGSTPAASAAFAEAASATVRAADQRHRPITYSLSSVKDWPELFSSRAVDIVQAHPYALDPPYSGRLCDLILDVSRSRLKRYGKPLLLGECGLDWRPPAGTLTSSERAAVGIRQAVWAGAVSGAMSGRMLWWEDGYDKYEHAGVAQRYASASAAVARFVSGLSYTGLKPADVEFSSGLRGGALVSADLVIGWFSDVACDPPDWPERTIAGAAVRIAVGGTPGRWQVELVDTRSGSSMSTRTIAGGSWLEIPLPPFRESIALKASRAR